MKFVGADVWGDKWFDTFHSSMNSVVLKFAYWMTLNMVLHTDDCCKNKFTLLKVTIHP